MSHAPSAGPGRSVPPLPKSGGVAFGVRLLIFGGVLLATFQGFFTVFTSNFGRVWPAENSATISLPPASLQTTKQ